MIQGNKKGFTMTELMLAMSIVSILMLAIATMVIQMTNTITRGNTYRDLNISGRSINTDLTKTFNSLSSMNGWDGRENNDFFRKIGGSGAFCTGDVSYLWNNNSSLDARVPIRYSGTSENDDSIRLIKIKDSSRSYCKESDNGWTNIPRNSSTIEVLSSTETNLRIYDIDFSTNDSLKSASSGQTLINISYVLGTPASKGLDINNLNCNSNAKSNYCAVNRFDLTVRTLGRKG